MNPSPNRPILSVYRLQLHGMFSEFVIIIWAMLASKGLLPHRRAFALIPIDPEHSLPGIASGKRGAYNEPIA